MNKLYGYNEKLLRMDLINEKGTEDKLDEATLRKWVGGRRLPVKLVEKPPVQPSCLECCFRDHDLSSLWRFSRLELNFTGIELVTLVLPWKKSSLGFSVAAQAIHNPSS